MHTQSAPASGSYPAPPQGWSQTLVSLVPGTSPEWPSLRGALYHSLGGLAAQSAAVWVGCRDPSSMETCGLNRRQTNEGKTRQTAARRCCRDTGVCVCVFMLSTVFSLMRGNLMQPGPECHVPHSLEISSGDSRTTQASLRSGTFVCVSVHEAETATERACVGDFSLTPFLEVVSFCPAMDTLVLLRLVIGVAVRLIANQFLVVVCRQQLSWPSFQMAGKLLTNPPACLVQTRVSHISAPCQLACIFHVKAVLFKSEHS